MDIDDFKELLGLPLATSKYYKDESRTGKRFGLFHYALHYTLAGLTFAFIGGRSDKSYEKWEPSKELYNICSKALESSSSKRFKTIREFYDKWNQSLAL